MAIGHTRNADGSRQDLVSHLRSVAELSGRFADPLGAAEAGWYLGLWHDLGKFHPLFQRYLELAESGDASPRDRVDHKAAGAELARTHLGWPLSMVVAGHHGGLQSRSMWASWLSERKRTGQPAEALILGRGAVSDLEPAGVVPLPPHVEHAKSELQVELFLRLLFSALIDADSLDTERHFTPERARLREPAWTGLERLWVAFEASQRRLFGAASNDVVSRQRRLVYEACVRAGDEHPPGVFRLTVPTGGGKTRSGLAFALRHALRNGQQRIIVAVPFLTITDQTADVYRRIFDRDGSGGVVLEDHSGFRHDEDDESLDAAAIRARLAAENWDAPVVVTTTVQLFESLFANQRSRCRKLHRLTNSVIVLDEAQALPASLLAPMLDVLRDLAANYNTSIVLSTATQPAFQEIPEFSQVAATEIVPDASAVFAALHRVAYSWELDTPLPWSAVAGRLRDEPQVLAVVNTKRDAIALLDALSDPESLHLSTALCGAHRRVVLAEVRRRLASGEACRLVSTQVVEAGVDIDFPVVYRAIGPLSSVIQAAGRCNREGRRPEGRVVVFDPAAGGLPTSADYRVATDQTRALVRSRGEASLDADDPRVATDFFRAVYQLIDTDAHRIQNLRSILDFPEVARRFQMIEPSMSVVVPYGSNGEPGEAERLAIRLRDPRANTRQVLRALQPYLVSMPQSAFDRYVAETLVEEIIPGVGRWLGRYDPVRGLVESPALGESLVV